jgi:hypothetical protein
MKIITKFTLLAILLVVPFTGFAQDKKKQRIIDANPSLYYPFESVTTAADPLVGSLPLQFFTYSANKEIGDPGGEPGEAAGPYIGKGAVLISADLHVQVPNPVVLPEGERVRTYTLLYDFTYPASGLWYALFQGKETNDDDADIFIRNSDNALGVGTPGYATEYPLSIDTWYRFVVTLSFDENGVGTEKFYLNGEEIFSRTGGNKHIDLTMNTDGSGDRFSIGDFFWIFTDEDREEHDISCAGFAFWADRALTANEVAALGGMGYDGFPFAELPVLSGKERTTIQAENFDDGGDGVAYTSTSTATNTYREEPVQIEAGPGEGNYHLTFGTDDWYNYSFTVPQSRTGYDYILYLYGQKTTVNNFNVLVNGVLTENTTDVEFPASYDEPAELPSSITLKPGRNIITIQAKGGNFDKIEFEKAAFNYEGTPFTGEPIAIPGAFEAEDFDLGGEGIAYHDSDASNSGPTNYRPDAPGMDIQTQDNGIINIGWTSSAEWINYSILVAEDGLYDLSALLATADADKTLYVDIDDERVCSIIAHTPNHQTFLPFSVLNIPLKAGAHILTISSTGDINYDRYVITKVDRTPYNASAFTIPGIIPAAEFDKGASGYSDLNPEAGGAANDFRTDVGVAIKSGTGGYYITGITSGEWLAYSVNIQKEAIYDITFKVAGVAANGNISLAGPTTETIKVPVTSGETDWVDVTIPRVTLKAGASTLLVNFSGDGYNLAEIAFVDKTDATKIDITNWYVPLVSDEEPSDGGGANSMLDGSMATFWHSVYKDESGGQVLLPHWAIIDTDNEETFVKSLLIYRRNLGYAKSIELYAGDDSNETGIWTKVAAGQFPTNGAPHALELVAANPIKARYLKLVFPDSYSDPNTHIDVVEIVAFSDTDNAIKLPANALPGLVYAENGKLHAKGFSATASLAVYNLLGQKITNYKTLNGDVAISLPTKGIYIVKVQDKGLTSTYKVIVK